MHIHRKPPKKKKSGDPNPPAPETDEIPKVPEHGPGIWCMYPLLEKLPSVQARIIKIAGQVMEKMNFFNVYRYEEEEEEEEDDESDSSEEDSQDEDSTEDEEMENKAER